MFKSIIALMILSISFGAFSATLRESRAIRINSKIIAGESHTSVFNGSIFTTVCRGQIKVLTDTEEVLVHKVEKLVVRGNESEVISLQLNEGKIIDNLAEIKCYN